MIWRHHYLQYPHDCGNFSINYLSTMLSIKVVVDEEIVDKKGKKFQSNCVLVLPLSLLFIWLFLLYFPSSSSSSFSSLSYYEHILVSHTGFLPVNIENKLLLLLFPLPHLNALWTTTNFEHYCPGNRLHSRQYWNNFTRSRSLCTHFTSTHFCSCRNG